MSASLLFGRRLSSAASVVLRRTATAHSVATLSRSALHTSSSAASRLGFVQRVQPRLLTATAASASAMTKATATATATASVGTLRPHPQSVIGRAMSASATAGVRGSRSRLGVSSLWSVAGAGARRAGAGGARGFASDATGGEGDVMRDSEMEVPISNYRNLAIIAHVDHGKTTLVDCLLRQSNTRIASTEERVMDSNALEKERGITILAKNTSILWKDPKVSGAEGVYRMNIVDTPGHADFGGEVERIMSMVDGVCLVVDAADGPMTQTKFVLGKALKRGLRPIVVINKVDRPNARIGQVENEIFDLFVALEASDEQANYPVVYASAREGFAFLDPKAHAATPSTSMNALFATIARAVPAPVVNRTAPFSMLVTMIEGHKFLGKCLLGRVQTGKVKAGEIITALDPKGNKIEEMKVLKVLTRRGLEQVAVEEGGAGEIISLAGFNKASVNATLCHSSVKQAIASTPIDPPTVSMTFSVNTSPLMGQEGKKVNAAQIADRLRAEAETNVSIRLYPSLVGDGHEVHGRGELQLGILIENMRREGFELSISPPRVVYKKDANGQRIEPLEEAQIDCDQEHSGAIIEKLSLRKGEVKDYTQTSDGRTRLVFTVPTRGLLGLRNELNTLTQGSAVLNSTFHSYVPFKGGIDKQSHGAIISMEAGETTGYALNELQSRGTLFIGVGAKVYPGMVIGEHNRDHDIEVNPVKSKAFSNVRSVIKEEKKHLTPPRLMSLEEVIAYMRDDEVIEVTTSSIRLRKRFLSPEDRKRWKRENEAALKAAEERNSQL